MWHNGYHYGDNRADKNKIHAAMNSKVNKAAMPAGREVKRIP